MAASVRPDLRVVNASDGIDSESRTTRMGGERRSFGRARPSITSTSTAKAEHEYEYEWKVRASQHSFLCVLRFLLFVLFFVFALASIVPQFSRPAGDRKRHEARTPSHARSCSIRGWVLNGPTRLRFELVRAGASPIQARSASKWNPAFWSLLRRGEAAYGVRELVTAFWSTAARKHPSSRVPISQLRSAISDTLRPRRS